MSLESIAAEIRKDIAKLTEVLHAIEGTAAKSVKKGFKTLSKEVKAGKRTMSASARRRISQAQKARWAKFKAKKNG